MWMVEMVEDGWVEEEHRDERWRIGTVEDGGLVEWDDVG